MTLSDLALQRLAAYPWPGNVRELRNVMEYAAAAVTEDVVEPWHLDERLGTKPAAPPATNAATVDPAATPPLPTDELPKTLPRLSDEVEALERTRMTQALALANGNQTRAAQAIGMPLRTFVTKTKLYGLRARN